MKIIEAYHCDYCKKYSKSKGVITRHEKRCYHNPVTRACVTCVHFYQAPYTRPYNSVTGQTVDITDSRPMCDEGVQISTLTNDDNLRGHKIDLKHECPLWEPHVYNCDEDDEE